MKTMTMFLIALLCCSFGCEAQFATEYRVGIDPAFTQDYQTAITEAVAEWQTKLGNQVHFTLTYASCSRNDGQRLICFHPADNALFEQVDQGAGHIGVTLGVQDSSASSDIYLKLSALRGLTWRTMTIKHEFGHGIGEVHCNDLNPPQTGKHIMQPNTSLASLHVTCADALQYLEDRKPNAPWGGSQLLPACTDPTEPITVDVPLQTGAWD